MTDGSRQPRTSDTNDRRPGQLRRLVAAYQTLPTPRDWLETLAVTAAFGAFALGVGFGTGLFRGIEPVPASDLFPGLLLWIIFPSLAEETLFRVLPLNPHASRLRLRIAAVAAGAAFVLWHPLAAWVIRPEIRVTFWDRRFLTIVAGLAGACSALYLRTGSIWPPAVLHWITVGVWRWGLGGPEGM